MPIYYLEDKLEFPDPEEADSEGLLALGGSLKPDWLLAAYRKGIFPWFNEGDPILWWSPNPRMILYPTDFKRSKSFRNVINQNKYTVTFNCAFEEVLDSCGSIRRPGQAGTWITPDMKTAYVELHEMGWCHSVEVWNEKKQLVGGLYGVGMGRVFFGESMFSTVSNASKIALHYLTKRLLELEVAIIDCQVYTKHLESLGAEMIPRAEFIDLLDIHAELKKLEL